MSRSTLPERSRARTRLTGVAMAVAIAMMGAVAVPMSSASNTAPSRAAFLSASAPSPTTHGFFGPAGDNWTMYMGGYAHDSDQAVSPSLTPATAGNLSLQWAYQTGGVIVSQPAVANNRVYFGSWDGYEYALLASNGSKVWSTYTGQSVCLPTATHTVGVSSSPTLTPTALYFGGGKDYWYALNPTNGSVLWKIYTGNSNYTNRTGGGGHYNWASPLIYGGYAYIGLSSHCDNPLVQGQMLKVSLATHSVVQIYNNTVPSKLGADFWSSPSINTATGTIFEGSGSMYRGVGTNSTLDDSIIALNATRMTLVGHFQVPYAQRIADGDFGATTTLFPSDTGVPLVGDVDKNGIYYVLRQSNLSAGPIWQYKISTINTDGSAAYAFGNLYVGSARTTSLKGGVVQGALRSFNATTGALNWQDNLAGTVFGPTVVSGKVVVVAGGTELLVADASTGKLLFRFNSPTQFYGGPAIAGGRIYIGNTGGTFYCFGLPLHAKATASSTVGAAPLHEIFHGVATGGEPTYAYLWSFGKGRYSTAADPRFTFTKAGNYTVTLTVTDQTGATAVTSVTITVTDPVRLGRRRL